VRRSFLPPGNGRLAMLTTWAATRLAAVVSWRAARRPVSRLWFTPWRTPISARARDRHAGWLAEATPISLNMDGRRLAGYRAGDGPTVLLVHGWSDRAASLGAFVGPLVERGFTVAGIDLPGHGDSPGGRTNAFAMAETLRGIERELGGVDAIIAHSIGALVTILELGNDLDARAVALIAPLVRADRAVEHFAGQLRLSHRARRALRTDIESRFGSDVWDQLAADLIAPQIDVPALIVHDESDPETEWSDSSLLAEAWPGARLVTTQGLGHYRVVRDENVVDEISNFIADTVRSNSATAQSVQ
jgi:pimeloyl-ACP methyl ester carboxylesterase